LSRGLKLFVGLAAVLAMGWLWHGPLGQGEAFVAGTEAQARATLAATELPGLSVRLGRDPASREAILAGPADDFQRHGMGSFPGIDERILSVAGVSEVRWTDDPRAMSAPRVPLLVETLTLLAIAYVLGLVAGWYLFGRPERNRYA
jgi:hypothetical protein